MRIRALILIFPFAIFLAETVSLPMQITTRCRHMVCMKTNQEKNCSHKKDGCQKRNGKCDSSAPCSICPVCSIFVFQPQYFWSTHTNIANSNYQLLNTGEVSSFASDIWKPPNDYLPIV